MKQRIFEDPCQCPCSVKKDMEKSENVYMFFKEFFEEFETSDWEKDTIADLECAYCLVQSALMTAKLNKRKYSNNKISDLTNAKNSITEIFLEKTLDRLRYLLDHV